MRNLPFLGLLLGTQTIVHDQISWLWGAIFSLIISRYYFMPRRIQRLSAETHPSFIGNIYGSLLQGIVSLTFIAYLSLLLIKVVQQWIAFGYIDLSPQVLLVFIASSWFIILLLALLRRTSFVQKITTLLLLTLCLLIPILIYLFRPPLDHTILFKEGIPHPNILYTTYFPKLDPSIFLISFFIGHPLLSFELLRHKNKRKLSRFLKLASIILLFLAITNTLIFQYLGVRRVIPSAWQPALFLYRTVYTSLAVGWLLYWITIHLSYDLLRSFKNYHKKPQSPYLVATLLSTSILLLAYFIPSEVIPKLLTLTLPPLLVAQIICLALMVGLQPSKINIYLFLVSATLSHLILWTVSNDYFIPYILLLTIGATFSLFLGYHYVENNGFDLIKRNWWEKQDFEQFALQTSDITKTLKIIFLFPIKIAHLARQSVARQRIPYRDLSLYFCLTLLSGIHLSPIPKGSAENYTSLLLFILAFLLSTGVLLQSAWPAFLTPYFALYWHLSLSISLVAMPLSFYIISGNEVNALVHLILSIVLLARFINLSSFLSIQVIGILQAVTFTYYLTPEAYAITLQNPTSLYTLTYSYLLSSLVAITLIRKSKRELEETAQKLQVLVKKSIAIVSHALNITKSHASIIDLCSHTMDVTEEPDKEGTNRKVSINMGAESYYTMKQNIQKLLETTTFSRSLLKRSFLPIRFPFKKEKTIEYHVVPCIKEAIETFTQDAEVQTPPQLHIENDFTFKGSDQALIAILVELLTNAYEYSHTEGSIEIQVKNRYIYITNHGSTIPIKDKSHIFNQYFTSNPDKLGLGLFFVRKIMQSLGGDIYLAHTDDPNITQFVLSF